MINTNDYNHLIKIYALRFGMNEEELRTEFPHHEYEHYDDLEHDLIQKMKYITDR